MKRQKIKVKEKGRRVGFYPPLFTFYSSLSLFFALIFSVSATAQKVAILAPGKQTVPEFVEKLAEEISKSVTVLDGSLSESAFNASNHIDPFNMTADESKSAGTAIGCDFFVLVRTETQRLASLEHSELYVAHASIYVISSKTGHLIYWTNKSSQAVKSLVAEFHLPRSAIMISDELLELITRSQKSEFNESKPANIEELPIENSPASKNFRPPVPYRRIKPEYTQEAYLYTVTATVEILVDIDASGTITRTEIVRWAGFGLDESVEKAVRSMNWRPAERSGKPLPIRVLLRYNFKKTETKPS